MSQKYIPTYKPCTVDDVADVDGVPGWITRVRSAAQRDGQALRVGDDFSIEAKNLHTNLWQPVMLPGGGTQFVDAATATLVLAMLAGHAPIPTVTRPA